jgi:purine-binding chemotaxis protein CheW
MTAHVCVTVGAERYGVAVEHVREVTELGSIVPVPGAGPAIAGIRHLHGEILPVAHLSRLLGAPAGAPRRIVVVNDRDRCAGLVVDRADDVEELPEPPAPGEALMRGTVLHGDTVFGILDVPRLLDAIGGMS